MHSSRLVSTYTRARAIQCSSDLMRALLEFRKAGLFKITTYPASTCTANPRQYSLAHKETETNPHSGQKTATPSSSNQAQPARRIRAAASQNQPHLTHRAATMSLNHYVNSPSPLLPNSTPLLNIALIQVSSHRESPHYHSRRPHPNRHPRILRSSDQPRASRHDRAHHPRARR